MRRILVVALGAACLAAMAPAMATANLVKNGSLEDLNGRFTATHCGYMAVHARSHAIAKWTVPPATTGELAWGTNTCDGYTAAKGAFFVDLTGFGADSVNGAIRQTLRTRPGRHYQFSIDVCTCNDGSLSVRIGKKQLVLSPGQPFVVGSTSWTPMTARFKGGRKARPALTIMNATPGAQIIVIDDVVIGRP